MSGEIVNQSVNNHESVEKQLLSATRKINQMSKTINDQAKRLAILERRLEKEQEEKNEFERDYTHIVELFEELRASV